MTKYKKPKPCVDCGIPTTDRNKNGRCPECAFEAIRQNIKQRAARKGPHYEKWKEGMIFYADALKNA